MRVTNQMMSNNMMYNINKNKSNLSTLDEQYSSGKKIQRPSDDPIIAVRALRLRTNLSELNQYYEKNIPDAYAWMDVTESALSNVNTIMTKINDACVQGSNDTLTVSDRTSIVQNLQQYKDQIYQEGNSDYAGRYVFTGYKTDTSLTFPEYTSNLKYKITEKFTGKDIDTTSVVSGEYSLSDYNTDPTLNNFTKAPTLVEAHRIRLSYDNLSTISGITVTTSGSTTPTSLAATIVTKASTDSDAYSPAAGTVNYIKETGEIIVADDVYNNLRSADSINVQYEKKEFKEGDLRPEHYFDCELTDTSKSPSTTISYTKEDQQIQYEVNFGQKLTVNTQASDAITHDITRDINEILDAAQEVTATETKLAEVKKLLSDTSITDAQKKSLGELQDQLKTSLALKNDILQNKFESGISGSKAQQETLNVAVSDLGSRYKRLQLTETRLSDQQVEYEDLLSKNEDADVVETYINLTSAQQIYNASLSASAKIAKSTLLDFI